MQQKGGNLVFPVHLQACSWEVVGKQRPKRKATWTQGKHAQLHIGVLMTIKHTVQLIISTFHLHGIKRAQCFLGS